MGKHQTFLWTLLKLILFVIAVIILIYSLYQLYNYNKERIESKKLAEKVISESLSHKVAPINIDFEKLKQESSDIIAWLYCEGTPINYPVVQAADNSYYLHKGTDGEYSLSGTLFVDYLNNGDFTDNNTIIYGHNMKNGTMFGTLTEYINQEYYDEHSEMYILTPEKNFKVKLITGATVNSTASNYKLPLVDEEKENFISELREKSTFKSEYVFSPDDRYVMLSTCSYSYKDARYVLIGVLKEL